jgi:hypothetical protein
MRKKKQKPANKDFEQFARQADTNLLVEFWGFLKENTKWWLLPILIALALVGALVLLGGTGAAPFIYSLFLIQYFKMHQMALTPSFQPIFLPAE